MQPPTTLRRRVAAATVAVCLGALAVVSGDAQAIGLNGKIAFTNARSGNLDVWSMTSTGSDQVQLTSDTGSDTDPAPSPDGKFTAFIANRDGNDEVYTMKTNGATETRLTNTTDTELDPSFSPDSSRIAFARSSGSFDSHIWTMAADGSDQVQVTFEVEEDSSPVYSPDGSLIAFVRESNVWTTTLDGLSQTQLTTGGGIEPAFMPDGRIVFKRSNEIYVMNADGSSLVNLTNNAAFDADPTPSPDGNHIAFTTFRNGHFDVYVMEDDGSNQTNLTLLSIDDLSPAWGYVDASSPSTTIVGPGPSTMDTTPTFAFSADEEATFECSLHAQGASASFAPCASPFTASPALSAGAYVFEVRATDIDGNTESPAAAESFIVDLTPPTATISGTTPTNDPTPTLTFSFNEAVQAGATQCSLVASGVSDSFSSCASPFTASTLAPGDYVFKVKGTDVAGNVGTATSFSFTLDTSAPVVTITGATLTNDTTPIFSFSFNESVAGGSIECSLRPTGLSAAFSSCSSPYTHGAALADGAYTFKARANDLAGNTGSGSHAFTVDATGPIATITGTALTNDSTPSFTFSFNESVQAGSTQCSLVASGASDAFAACSSPYNHGTALSGGNYVFKVRGTDTLGNPGPAASFAFTVDTTGPTATISGSSLTNDTTPTMTFSFNEAVSAGATQCSVVPSGNPDSFASCSSPFTASTLGQGAHVFKVRGTDLAGNQGPAASFSFTVDSTGPVATITGPSVTSDNTPTFSFTFNEGVQSGTTQCSLRLTTESNSFSNCTSPFTPSAAVADGAYTFKVRASDLAGNVGTSSHAVTIDTTTPVATITGTTPTADNTPSLSFSFTESVASSSCSLQASGGLDSFSSCTSPFVPASPLADGAHVFKVFGLDGAGNQGPTASYTFTVDTTGPVGSISGPTLTNDRTPTFTFGFNESTSSGSVQCSLRPTGQADAFASCTSPFTASPSLADGDYTFKVKASDQLANAGAAVTHAFTIDGSAPAIVITSTPGAATNDTTPSFEFTTGDSVTVECSLELASASNDFNACASPYDAAALTNGSYEFKVRGTDAADNTGSATHSFIVDITGPTASITAASETNDTTPSISFTFNEPVQAPTVECSLEAVGISDAFALCASPFVPASSLVDGDYVFKVRASDALGNPGDAASKSFTVDTVGPTVVITGKARTKDRTPKFTFTSSETGVSYECAVNSKPFASCQTPYTSKRLKAKKHTLHVRATDQAGNTGPVTDFVFKIRR